MSPRGMPRMVNMIRMATTGTVTHRRAPRPRLLRGSEPMVCAASRVKPGKRRKSAMPVTMSPITKRSRETVKRAAPVRASARGSSGRLWVIEPSICALGEIRASRGLQ